MDVRILVGAEHAYACIKTRNKSMDIRLDHGVSASTSLRRHAEELRAKAARLLESAVLAELAASKLEGSAGDMSPANLN
jgi:hypothetical protein